MANNDKKIKDLLSKIDEQKAKMGSRPKAAWITNGIFKADDKNFVNLNAIKDKDVIIDNVALLLNAEALRSKAAELLGLPEKPAVVSGYSVPDWISDFKLRVQILNWEEENKKLEDLKKKLGGLISEEAKTEMELADIEAALK